MREKKRITPYELLSLAVSFLGLISLIIIFVQTREIAKQTKHSAVSLESTAYKAITDQETEVDKLFMEHPTLRPYFYSGLEISEDNPDYPVAEAMAEYLLDFFDSAKHQLNYRREVHPDVELESWKRYFDDSFRNSPILCKRLNQLADWYDPDFVNDERAVCSKASKKER